MTIRKVAIIGVDGGEIQCWAVEREKREVGEVKSMSAKQSKVNFARGSPFALSIEQSLVSTQD